ncbi:Zn-dependent exopeptidase M28 [Candidatus Beckwithbacteria bacterium]|nr:Zn-dependent exopeptidase M28 [Candidatus Beckwithbacteria bacterium]
MNFHPLLTKLTQISPRYAEKEIVAARIIEDFLQSYGIPYKTQPFTAQVPAVKKAKLIADGKAISCLGSCLVSGQIPDGNYLVSHYGYSGQTPYNIAYSPVTDSISVVDHFKIPSVTISRKDITKIVMAQTIKGFVEVEKRKINTENILVGNLKNPTHIVFAHFDSIIGPGALDNAGAVAVMMACFVDNQRLLENTLFNFSGNEEIAYDDYKLSGYGFRVFEKKYGNLLANAKKIFVLDGVGIGTPSFSQNGLDWVLQVKMLDKIRNKVFWLQNDQAPMMKYFHSTEDKLEILKEKYLRAAQETLTKEIAKK